MRLYLSSLRMGDHPEHLVALAGGDGRRSVVIANAMDGAPPEVRRASVELELAALADLGLGAAELDLRDYFGHQQRLRRDLAGVAMAWLRGGNTFMLRYALDRASGTTDDYAVGDLLPAHFVVGVTRLACRHVLTLRPEEPKARAGGVGHSGDPPEALVGSLGEHCAAERADFRDRGVDIIALPEHRPVRRFSGRQRLHLVADPGDWSVVVRSQTAPGPG